MEMTFNLKLNENEAMNNSESKLLVILTLLRPLNSSFFPSINLG